MWHIAVGDNRPRHMKGTIFITVLYILTAACTRTVDLPDGWYNITDIDTGAYAEKPIATVKEFESLKLDSMAVPADGSFIYMITGKMKPGKVRAWSNATEKAAGTYIGFLLDGKIICAPMVNMSIPGGIFSISPREISGDGKKMKEILEKLQKQMPGSGKKVR